MKNCKLKLIYIVGFMFCLGSISPPIIFAGGGIESNTPPPSIVYPTIMYDASKVTNAPNEQISLKGNGMNWNELIIGTLLGWVLGFVSVWLVDYLKEPNLRFEVGSIADDPTNTWRFVHIRIKNLGRKFKFSPFTASPAFGCKALVTINDKQFVGRWTSKEQPIGNISNVINLALVHPREDIFPYTMEQEAVEIAVGLKYETEDEFYGFNNENYLPGYNGYRDINKQFGIGIFSGELKISTLGKVYSQKFRISNLSKNRRDFKLELVS